MGERGPVPDISYYKFFFTHSRSANYNKNACTIIKHSIYFQKTAVMEAGSFLTPEEAARMGGENPAAAAAAAKGDNPGHGTTGNGPKPATSGFVQTAKCLPSASERSKLIRINRELNNKPTVLGGGGVPLLFLTLKLSTLWGMGG
jgi:hypothetical protein